MRQKLLIVGAGMATARLLQELVAQQADYAIEVIGEELQPCYNRILLSSLLCGQLEDQLEGQPGQQQCGQQQYGQHQDAAIELHDRAWYSRNDITVATGETVLGIDTASKFITTSVRARVDFDQLVIATGSIPFMPPIAGIDAGNVFAFRNQADLLSIRTAARAQAPAVVIGGGLLGLEAAHGLLQLGMEVTVINREEWLMPRQLDKSASDMLQHTLQQSGMEFRLNTLPVSIHAIEGKAASVALNSGEVLPAALVLITAGVLPNISLAQRAGIACDRGILVDARLATNHPDIFALGECCQVQQQLFGLVAPVYAQAAVLAARLSGNITASYVHRDTATQLKVAGVNVVSAGQLPFPVGSQSQLLVDRASKVYRRLVFDGRRLVGFVLLGNTSHRSHYESLLAEDNELNEDIDSLMFMTTELARTAPGSPTLLNAVN